MKPLEKKPEVVFRIIGRESGEACGSYSRAYCDEYDFRSIGQARSSNCHDVFQDKAEYKIAKYKVTYELIDDDVDPASQEELDAHRKKKEDRAAMNAEMEERGITSFNGRLAFEMEKAFDKYFVEETFKFK